MTKLVVCLLSGLALAAVLLQLRQQELELNYQTNQLHSTLAGQQAKGLSYDLTADLMLARRRGWTRPADLNASQTFGP